MNHLRKMLNIARKQKKSYNRLAKRVR